MKFLTSILPLALFGLASADVSERRGLGIARRRPETAEKPTASLKERSTETCDQWGTIETGSYIVYNDLWGESYATSGSQCTTVSGLTNGILSWSTSWTWAGGSSNVKSYANAALDFTATELSAISSLTAVWSWRWVTGSRSTSRFVHTILTRREQLHGHIHRCRCCLRYFPFEQLQLNY